MRSGAVMAWSNLTWYYVSMAWCRTAVAPLLTHWSCCSLAVGHRYNTGLVTGLDGKQSSNRKRHPTSRPHRLALGCLFLKIYEIYRTMTAPQSHWNLVCLYYFLFFSTHNIAPVALLWHIFCSNNVPSALIDALLLGSRECKWEQIALVIFSFIFILFFVFFLLP